MYHVTIDKAFPYRVCGGQQDSGSACVESRSNDGEITFHDWHPVNIQEYGEAAPDPKDPDLVYGSARTGVSLYNRQTGQTTQLGPDTAATPAGSRSGAASPASASAGRGQMAAAGRPPAAPAEAQNFNRNVRTMPIEWSPVNPSLLFYAQNAVFKTLDGGPPLDPHQSGSDASDLDAPGQCREVRGSTSRRPSDRHDHRPLAVRQRRQRPVGRHRRRQHPGDDGRRRRTGKTSRRRRSSRGRGFSTSRRATSTRSRHTRPPTPCASTTSTRISGGRTTAARAGRRSTPASRPAAVANAIREDPKQKGLLYAATDTQVWVSYDDGDSWQSLRLDMPAVSVRDLEVKDDASCLCADLVAGTHGRGYLDPRRRHAAARRRRRYGPRPRRAAPTWSSLRPRFASASA